MQVNVANYSTIDDSIGIYKCVLQQIANSVILLYDDWVGKKSNDQIRLQIHFKCLSLLISTVTCDHK